MGVKKKKIEFYKVLIKDFEGNDSALKFDDIVSSKDIVGKEIFIKGKDLELKIYKNNKNVIIGHIETSRNNNVPPKKNKKAKKLSKLGLNSDEGLAYGNVFLYDKKREILLYEVNKFGCYLDHFISFIYLALKDAKSELFKKFRIKLEVVLTSNEYYRIVNMNFHKSIEVQVAQPHRIIDDLKHKNGALYNVCNSGNEFNSSRLSAKFEVQGKKKSKGLSSKTVRELMDDISRLLKTKSSENIQKVIIAGYENDIKKLQKIDLIANRYIKYIEIDEPRESGDLLEGQRNSEIKKLHKNSINDLDSIFG